MQYVMEILIALAVTVGFAILCCGVKRLCRKAIQKTDTKKEGVR